MLIHEKYRSVSSKHDFVIKHELVINYYYICVAFKLSYTVLRYFVLNSTSTWNFNSLVAMVYAWMVLERRFFCEVSGGLNWRGLFSIFFCTEVMQFFQKVFKWSFWEKNSWSKLFMYVRRCYCDTTWFSEQKKKCTQSIYPTFRLVLFSFSRNS